MIQGLYEDLRKKFWAEVATGNGRDFVEAKLAERDTRHQRQGESRYLVEPNIKEGKGGLRDLQTLYWIGKYLYHVDDAADLVEHGVFTKDEYRTFQKAEAFLWNVRVHLHYLLGRAEERLSFDVQPALAAQLGYVDAEKPRRAVEAFMRAYFLTAKDVGDLTRIFCAALEEQHRKPRPSLSRILPGFLKARSPEDDFYVANGRLTANPAIFRQDPANILRIFHVADVKGVDIHPDAMRVITRSLDLITNDVRNNPVANQAFLEVLTSRHDPERASAADERGRRSGPLHPGVRPRRRVDAIQHVPPLYGGRAPDPRRGQCRLHRARRAQGRQSARHRRGQARQVPQCPVLRHPAA